MPRKIYDIKPPKTVHKTGKEVQDKNKKRPRRNQKGSRSAWFWFLFCICIFVLALGTYLFFKLPEATIAIWPKVDTLSFQQTITADKSVNALDLVKSVIPAQYFQAVKTNSQNFPATGNALNEGRATGNITIYNKYDPPTPLTFRAGTHFMSDSGKLFVSFQRIVIPAAKKSGSKITPGSVQVQVQAVEGGTGYNIAPSNFSVPGLKGTAYYYGIYAVSTIAMTGGYTGTVKKVTDDDIQGAKDILTEKTTTEATAALKNQIPSDFVLLDNAAMYNVADASTQIKSGAIAENFNYSVTVQASALAFKNSDIDQFVRNYIISQIPEGKTLLDSSFKSDYSASVVDISGGKATINLNFSSGFFQNIDKNSIILSTLGKNDNQIRETINSSLGDQVSRLSINFWPFWVNSAPNSQKAVNIELKFQ